MSLDEVLGHLRFLCAVTDLPVNADFEAGFADTADGVGVNVGRCIETGVAGLSIEDRDGQGFYPVGTAVARIAAARAAIDRSGQDVVLVGRCEAYLMDPLDLESVIARLNAYGDAGADCLYAPGLKTLDDIARVVVSVKKPVNANLTGTGLSVDEMAAVGRASGQRRRRVGEGDLCGVRRLRAAAEPGGPASLNRLDREDPPWTPGDYVAWRIPRAMVLAPRV